MMFIWTKLIDFTKHIFINEGGAVTSKRFVGLLTSIILCIALIVNPTDTLVNAVALLAFGALGLSSVDKFINMKEKTNTALKSDKKDESN